MDVVQHKKRGMLHTSVWYRVQSFYSPYIEESGEGGHVEGELGVAPVQHILGDQQSHKQDPWIGWIRLTPNGR